MIHTSKKVHSGAEVSGIGIQFTGNGKDVLDFGVKDVVAGQDADDAVFVDWKLDLWYWLLGDGVVLLVNNKSSGYWEIDFFESVLSELIVH